MQRNFSVLKQHKPSLFLSLDLSSALCLSLGFLSRSAEKSLFFSSQQSSKKIGSLRISYRRQLRDRKNGLIANWGVFKWVFRIRRALVARSERTQAIDGSEESR